MATSTAAVAQFAPCAARSRFQDAQLRYLPGECRILHGGLVKMEGYSSVAGNFCYTMRVSLRRRCRIPNSQEESTTPLVSPDDQQQSSIEVEELNKESTSRSLLSFLCPLLKLIGSGDPAAPRNAFFETATSGIASVARLAWGKAVNTQLVSSRSNKPLQLFKLYEFEACPFCRRVREALTELDLSAEVYPCPKGSRIHRPYVKATGGKEQFPYFVDPNTGVSVYESADIVKYLFKEYGGRSEPPFGLLESTLLSGWVPTLIRAGRGMSLWSGATSNPPEKMLELYSYENNQFARLVREALCELELPYILWNTGKGSSINDKLLRISGSTKVPYLVDPNTGSQMGESLDIVKYLFSTYSNGPA